MGPRRGVERRMIDPEAEIVSVSAPLSFRQEARLKAANGITVTGGADRWFNISGTRKNMRTALPAAGVRGQSV